MEKFLDRVAEKVLTECGESLQETLIILPSKRASTFFLNALSKQNQSPSFSPKLFSLEDFVAEYSKLVKVEAIELLLELYQLHQKIEGNSADNFESFIGWGGTLLQDFNEIDRYLIDGEALFTYLTEAKAIEQWNLNQKPLTEFQNKYLSFWRKLARYYKEFKNVLEAKGKAYAGMQFRALAEKGTQKEFQNLEVKNIFVVGFNAFTKAEEQILSHLSNLYKLQYLWDSDEYYLNDSKQEAGKFLRDMRLKKPKFEWVFDDLLRGEKKIKIYGVSANIGQAKTLANILKQNQESDAWENTAVVLADEELLSPVLESIPEEVGRVNVTMGASLKHSYFFDFFEHYLQIALSLESENQTDKSIELSFYHAPLRSFLNHPACRHFNEEFNSLRSEFLQLIQKENKLWLKQSELEPLNRSISINLFPKQLSIKELLNTLQLICKSLMEYLYAENESVDVEYLAHFEQQFRRLIEVHKQNQALKTIRDLYLLYKQMISESEVAFVGEPLSGLQIMGVLESRLLDFDKVILSSLNEGLLPAGKKQNSFIPFDIKRNYGLPSYQEKDAIYAYHFYRLMQRANEIHLLYNTKVDQMYGGEKSRFLNQLMQELNEKNPNAKIEEVSVIAPVKKSEPNETIIKKDKNCIQSILAHLKSGLSPSALNTYLSCPLDYYFKYVLNLKEDEEIEEELSPAAFGNIMHYTLENIYVASKTPLNTDVLEQTLKQMPEELSKQYEKVAGVKPEFGIHLLAFEAAQRYLKNVILMDKSLVENGNELIIEAIEQKFETELKIEHPLMQSLKLKGKIDRIDMLNGKRRLIDYKSGKVDFNELKTTNTEQLVEGKKPKMVQLMHYLAGTELDLNSTSAGIISMKNHKAGMIPLKLDDAKAEFNKLIEKTVIELLDQSIPFMHNPDAKYCEY